MNDILKLIPEMKAGNALISALSVLPAYDENIRSQNEAVRLIALSDLYRMAMTLLLNIYYIGQRNPSRNRRIFCCPILLEGVDAL